MAISAQPQAAAGTPPQALAAVAAPTPRPDASLSSAGLSASPTAYTPPPGNVPSKAPCNRATGLPATPSTAPSRSRPDLQQVSRQIPSAMPSDIPTGCATAPSSHPSIPRAAAAPNALGVHMDPTPKEHTPYMLASAFLGKKLVHNHEILGKTCVSFRKEDKFRFLSKLKFMIVAKFSHLRSKYDDFLEFLKSLKFSGAFDIVAYNLKHVFVSFNVFEDFAKLWMLKSVIVKGFPIRFFQWDCDFKPTIESFVAPVWIHLPDIPVFLLDEDVILTISMAFGKPLYIDPRNLSHKLVGMLSFCVAMDVREVRKDSIWIEFIGEGINVERFSQKVEYGVVPSFCQSCSHLGHSLEECKLALPTDLRELIDTKKKIVDQRDFQENIPVVSVFKRLSCLGASTSGKELEGSNSTLGRNLEDVEVEDTTYEEELDLENQNSASIAVQEPPLKQPNSLCGENGEKEFGFLEKGVQNVQLSRSFEVLSAVEEEITAVENGFLQENSANSVEEATLQADFSQLKQDLQVIPSDTISTPGNLQVPEEILEKSQKGCSERVFENGEVLQSAADSAGKATLHEDFSLIKKALQVISSSFDSLPGVLNDAEESLKKASKGGSENEFEKGILLHPAAETVEVPTLGDHILKTRDIQPMILGVPESSFDNLQNFADLDLIVPNSEDISDPEDVSSSFAGSAFNGHNSCSEDDTELILGPMESQEDTLQIQPILYLKGTAGSVLLWLARKVLDRVEHYLYPSESTDISLELAQQVLHKVGIIQGITPTIADHQDKGVKQVQNMLVNKLSPTKVVITHPITKEVIVLESPTRSQSSMPCQASTVPVSRPSRGLSVEELAEQIKGR